MRNGSLLYSQQSERECHKTWQLKALLQPQLLLAVKVTSFHCHVPFAMSALLGDFLPISRNAQTKVWCCGTTLKTSAAAKPNKLVFCAVKRSCPYAWCHPHQKQDALADTLPLSQSVAEGQHSAQLPHRMPIENPSNILVGGVARKPNFLGPTRPLSRT